MLPSVEPGYLHSLIPNEVPEQSESWKDVMKDMNNKILPGMTHWQSNHFHAYFPSQSSYPSIVGDMIANGLGTVSFSWVSYRSAQKNSKELLKKRQKKTKKNRNGIISNCFN